MLQNTYHKLSKLWMQLWSVHTVTVLLKENGSFSKWVGSKVDSVHQWLLHC